MVEIDIENRACMIDVYVLVPERGNYPFMNGPAPYMNGYLNMNGAVFVVPSMNCTEL